MVILILGSIIFWIGTSGLFIETKKSPSALKIIVLTIFLISAISLSVFAIKEILNN